MLNRFRHWLQSASFNDPIERRQAPLIQLMLVGLILIDGLSLPLTLLYPGTTINSKLLSTIGISFGILSFSACLILMRRQRFAWAVSATVISLLVSIAILLIPAGLNSSWLTFLVLMYPITFAGLVAKRRMLWITIALSAVVIAVIGFLGSVAPALVGYEAPVAASSAGILFTYIFIVSFLGLAFDRFGSALRVALETALLREQELEQIRANQEATITARTDALQNALSEVEQREASLVEALEELRASQAVVEELSAPVVPVLAGVLVAPLVGALSGERAELLTTNVLRAVEQQRARYLIFDITGVPLVDSYVAKVLVQTTAAIQMLGARVFIVGIRPEVAQTMVALNIELAAVTTYPDLQKAVEALLQRDGWSKAQGYTPTLQVVSLA